jgi:hypothetical protein
VTAAPPAVEEALAALDKRVEAALAAGDSNGLQVLGYGEISTVLVLETPEGRFAAKRLPPFRDAASFAAYAQVFDAYLEVLNARSVATVASRLVSLEGRSGTRVAYCLQPILPADTLLPRVLAAASPDEALRHLDRVLAATVAVIDEHTGLDAQASNWVLVDGELRYLDVTTPLLRDERLRLRLDASVFLASLPWLVRPPVRRFVLPGIIERYHDRRAVLLDLAANLWKERLDRLVAPLLERIARLVERPVTLDEAERYYRSDAATWSLLQRLRRADRFWQRHVRRRVYPFLLPGSIER